MKAGTALGLLAGLGAMNAMSGKPYGGKRFTGLIDMLDGGGAGQSGDKFEGGGLLSALGNLFMKPMQAQQNVERIADKVRAEKLGMTTGTPITEYSDSLLAPIVNPDVYGIGEGGEFAGTPTVAPDMPSGLLPMTTPSDAYQAVQDQYIPVNRFGLGNDYENEMTQSKLIDYAVPQFPNKDLDDNDYRRLTAPTLTPMNVGLLGGGDDVVSTSSPAIDDGAEGSMLTRGDMVYSGRSNTGMPDRPELQYSGRGTSVGGFSPALYASMIDELNKMGMSDLVDTADSQAMMDLYSTYVQNGGALY